MGWNTWCTLSSCHQNNYSNLTHAFHDVCNEYMIRDVATAMINNGMQKAGYNWVNLDDCWEAETRTADGAVQADSSRFPSGMPALVDWLHKRGFHFGLYLSAGWTTCSSGGRPDPIPGSIGHYQQDTDTVASWGVDLIKLDWCGTTNTKAPPYKLDQANATTGFSKAANATGHPMWLYFHCDHVDGNIPSWCPAAGQSYRIGPDHHDNWDNTASVIQILKQLGDYGRAYAINDPDFLMTGGAGCDVNVTSARCPGQTHTEYRTEVSLWSMAASPLLVATDVRMITTKMQELLLNPEIIAIDQDDLVIAGGLVATWPCEGGADCDIWSRPLANGDYAVAVFNADDNRSHNITVKWDVVQHAGWGADTTVKVRDVWARSDVGAFKAQFTAEVESHGTNVYRLTKQ